MPTETAENGIRRYGPGKFNTILDSYVHQMLLDGCDEEVGSVDETGRWYGLMRGPFEYSAMDLITLNKQESSFLLDSTGVIVSEDSQGFVDVDYFDPTEDIESVWDDIVAAHETEGDSDNE